MSEEFAMVVWWQWKLLQNQYGSGYYYGTYFLPHCFFLAKSGVSNSVECRNLFFIFKVHVSHYFMLLRDLWHRFVFCPLLHTNLHFSIILDLDCYTQILTGIDTEKPSFLRIVWGGMVCLDWWWHQKVQIFKVDSPTPKDGHKFWC